MIDQPAHFPSSSHRLFVQKASQIEPTVSIHDFPTPENLSEGPTVCLRTFESSGPLLGTQQRSIHPHERKHPLASSLQAQQDVHETHFLP